MEIDDLVHTVDELGAEEIVEGFDGLFLALLIGAHVEADTAGALVAAGVRRHNDHGVFEIHGAALRVGDASVVENLEKDVHHVRMRLFDLVEKNDAVRLAADLLGELSGLVVADIARRRTDDA